MDGSVTIIAGRDPLPPYGVHVNMFIRALFAWPCVPDHAFVSSVRLNHALGLRDAMLELVDTLALRS